MPADIDTTSQLVKVLPHIAVISGISSLVGWSLRGKFGKTQPVKTAVSATPQAKDRTKNLEAALEKAKETQKSLKAELEALKSHSVSTTELEKANAEAQALRGSLYTETKRVSAMEADLKKAQDTIKNLNNRANEGDKAQKDRSFALENELSKTRQQLAVFEGRPDDTAGLHTEIERLRESVAVSTRYAGEVRKREVAAVEALEKAQAQLAEMGSNPRPAAVVSKKVGPVGDSDRVSAAKAEVLRLVEANKKKAPAAMGELPLAAEKLPVAPEKAPVAPENASVAPENASVPPEKAPVAAEEASVAPEEAAVAPEEASVAPEEASVAPEKAPVATEEAPAIKKPAVPGDLFTLE